MLVTVRDGPPSLRLCPLRWTPRRARSGRARLVDADATYALLRESVAQFDPDPEGLDLSEEHVRKVQAGVVGFEIYVTRLEGKWKMSQNKTEGDRQGVIAALSASGRPEERDVSARVAAHKPVGES